ncbi:MAG: NADH-quinone oxidoreductase subunit NuoG [Acidimicrobiales bacterium]
MADPLEVVTTVSITIDGRPVEARPGELLIAAAERAGTYIPRFCYHPRMEPVGMCRMCIVEVDTGRGPALQPSCMIPVAEGMAVSTESDVTKKAQDGVLEFLLINHPLDCPVCDKGGECPLQDQTLAFGPGESRFVEEKRHYEKPIPLSGLVSMDRERCILCDRCTRFAKDVAGDPLITFIGRGNETQVNTFPDDPFSSYFSGNTVQICPVGALLAKPYRFKARPWDLDQVESTCTACSVGCRMAVQSSTNRLVRHLGIDVDPVNWGWLCDKGRFDFEAVNAEERLGAPLMRKDEELVEVSWSEALTEVAERLAGASERHGAGSLAVLGGARLANEDAYAWSKLARTVLGTDNVDAQLGDGLPAEVVLGLPRATIDAACQAGTVVLLTPDIKEELPVLYLRLRDAVVSKGLRLIELSPTATGLTGLAAASLRYRPGEAAQVMRSLLAGGDGGAGDGSDDALREAAAILGDGPIVCVLGRPSLAESADSVVAAAGALLEARPGTTFLSALRRGNVHGALDMGLAPGVLPGRVSLHDAREWFTSSWGSLPDTQGLDAAGTLTAAAEGRIQGLVLLGADPLGDFPDRDLARRGIAGAGFVVAIDAFLTESSRQADVVLPAATFGERGGTTTNIEGRISRLSAKVTAPGSARADWMIAVELASRMGSDLGVESVDDLWDEIERVAPSHLGLTRTVLQSLDGADGVLAGPADDVGTAGAPPTMSQADEPGVSAAAAQGQDHLPGNVQTEEAVLGAGAAGGALGSEAVTEAFNADADTADYADGASEEAGGGEEAAVAAAAGAAEDDDAVVGEPSGGGTEGGAGPSRPPAIRFTAAGASGGPPPVDSYSLRLVSGRKLYDAGTFVSHAPSLVTLAPGANLRVNPADLDRLGVTTGTRVRVTSSRTSLVLVADADLGVPKGTAGLWFNQPGQGAADLIDVRGPVTDVRVETLGAGAGHVSARGGGS